MQKHPVMTRNGEGSVLDVLGTRVRFLCEAENTGGAWSAMEVRVPRDAGPPPHDHDWDEAYFVIEGAVEFTLGADTLLVRAGDFLYAPGGVPHGFRGVSDTDARVLILDAPAHAGHFFHDVHEEVRGPADFGKVPGIGDRHGIRFARRVPAEA